MIVIRTEQIEIKESDKLNELCHYSKNLWNEANYIVRKEFFNKKLNEIGCRVIEQNEAYTSKCFFLDNETIEHHEEYLGKRISRGLFQSSNGTIINADVNGELILLIEIIT